ncbi:10509_t:CDS:2, partial [Diversispora eburnea]
VSWEYFFSAQELDKDFENQQNLPPFGDNCGDWKFESSVKGFSVTIQQEFNENFAELRKNYYFRSEMPRLELGDKNLKPDFLENKYVNSSINRELKLETNKKSDK